MQTCSWPLGSAYGIPTDFKGSLQDISVFDLYRHLYLSRQTGALELRHAEAVKKIIFRNGSIVFAITNQDSERLGTFLLHHGKITSGQLQTVIQKSSRGKRLGRVVVEHGFLSEKELDSYVRMHQSEVAISALRWESGFFCFVPDPRTEYEDVYVELSAAEIIFEGVRRIPSPDMIHGLLGNLDAGLKLASDPLLRFQRISLDPQEAYIFSRVEGIMTVREISQVSALDEASTLKAVLGLILTGILEYSEKEGTDTHPEALRPDVIPKTVTPVARELDPCLAEEIHSRLQKLKSSTLYEILEVRPQAAFEELQRSYFQLSKRLHPDLYSHCAQPDLQQMGERLFRAIANAYQVLADPEQRAQYDRHVAGQAKANGPTSLDAEAEPLLKASVQAIGKRAFEQGLKDYSCGNYPAALLKLREAVRIDETMAPYRFYLAQTLARLPQRRREAELHYQIAIHQAPWKPEYYLALGELYQQAGLVGRAHACLEKARKLGAKLGDDLPSCEPHRKQGGIISRLLRL